MLAVGQSFTYECLRLEREEYCTRACEANRGWSCSDHRHHLRSALAAAPTGLAPRVWLCYSHAAEFGSWHGVHVWFLEDVALVRMRVFCLSPARHAALLGPLASPGICSCRGGCDRFRRSALPAEDAMTALPNKRLEPTRLALPVYPCACRRAAQAQR